MKNKITLIAAALGISAMLFAQSFSKSTHTPIPQPETIEIVAFNVQFSHKILTLIRSNQIDKAKTMLENSILLELQQLWEYGGTTGILSNQVCAETFSSLYTETRRQVGLERFQNLLPQARTNLARFINEVDPLYLKPEK